MTVSREQAEAMGRFLSALNNATDESAPISKATGKSEDSGLNQILEAFRSATDETIDHGKTNRDFNLAVHTEATPQGVRMGSWEISVRDEDFGKYYDICHSITKEPIASDLRLYDAAFGIVKALNEGQTFTCPTIKAIIDLEANYSRALSDAVNFSSRMKVTEGMKHDVAEARYGEARRQALTAKNAIRKLIK